MPIDNLIKGLEILRNLSPETGPWCNYEHELVVAIEVAGTPERTANRLRELGWTTDSDSGVYWSSC